MIWAAYNSHCDCICSRMKACRSLGCHAPVADGKLAVASQPCQHALPGKHPRAFWLPLLWACLQHSEQHSHLEQDLLNCKGELAVERNK